MAEGRGPSGAGRGPSAAAGGPSGAGRGPSGAGRGPSGAGRGPSAAGRGPSAAGRGPSPEEINAKHRALIENVVGDFGDDEHFHEFYRLHRGNEVFRQLVRDRLEKAFRQTDKEVAVLLTLVIDSLKQTDTSRRLLDQLNIELKFSGSACGAGPPATPEAFARTMTYRILVAERVAQKSRTANTDGGCAVKVSEDVYSNRL